MGRPKGNIESESIGIRMSSDLLHKLDEFADNSGITRSFAVIVAINHFLSGKYCILCGTLNHANGKKCCVCGTDLYSDEELLLTVNEFLKSQIIVGLPWAYGFIEEHFSERSEYLNKFLEQGYQPRFSFGIDRIGIKTKYHIQLSFTDNKGLEFTPIGEKVQIDITPETLLSFLEGAERSKSDLGEKR